jgi:hypothetical protein
MEKAQARFVLLWRLLLVLLMLLLLLLLLLVWFLVFQSEVRSWILTTQNRKILKKSTLKCHYYWLKVTTYGSNLLLLYSRKGFVTSVNTSEHDRAF